MVASCAFVDLGAVLSLDGVLLKLVLLYHDLVLPFVPEWMVVIYQHHSIVTLSIAIHYVQHDGYFEPDHFGVQFC